MTEGLPSGRAGYDPLEDGRLASPVFLRNSPPMIAHLARLLEARTGPVLEIGAGTGQHTAAFALAFPSLDWWASDPDPRHRTSISAWARHLGAPERPPLDLDASGDWPDMAEVIALGPLTAILSMNVIHVAPWHVARGIVSGAAHTLAPGGLLVFYGPFHENGQPTGPGNSAFDRALRAENPDWGIRDIADLSALARETGLELSAIHPMPADNRLIVFRKSD